MGEELPASSATTKPRAFARWYIGAAILLLNTALLFVLFNLLCWGILSVRARVKRPYYLTYSDNWYRTVYPQMADPDWKELLKETKDRPFAFQPYDMYTEPAYHGQYVNISDQGYRLVPHQGPWPMDPKNFNVLAFGGSTTFGYAVADDQTVPAYIQDILQKDTHQRVCVYNFGRRAYFSTQERILFEQLLRDGAKPNLVVFIDGLNDFLFAAEPTFQQQSQDELLAPSGSRTRLLDLWQSLPAGQMAQVLAKKFLHPKPPPIADWSAVDPIAINRYVWNIKSVESICGAQGIATAFVLQPNPTYHHDLILKDREWDTPGDQWVIHGYPLMVRYIKDHDMGNNYLSLIDMQEGNPDRLYVDKWHYAPAFANQIADEICKFLNKRNDVPVDR